ncbi:MAG: phosphoribosyltransferase [Chloroflexota bacterium]|nr:MAG: phosphoribosyltransferase [Chloroflexota bacterium]
MRFEDRRDAGRQLAAAMERYRGSDGIVLALPRGGVVVAYEVARHLELPLDVFIVRKVGAPGDPEFGIGAVAETGAVQINQQVIRLYGISPTYLHQEIERQKEEIRRRQLVYRDGRSMPNLKKRTVIVVDDGIATGYTALAAVRAIWMEDPREVVLAVPVAPPEAIEQLRPEVSELVSLDTPSPFYAVGAWYTDFSQTTDDEVRSLLQAAHQ